MADRVNTRGTNDPVATWRGQGLPRPFQGSFVCFETRIQLVRADSSDAPCCPICINVSIAAVIVLISVACLSTDLPCRKERSRYSETKKAFETRSSNNRSVLLLRDIEVKLCVRARRCMVSFENSEIAGHRALNASDYLARYCHNV